MTNVAAIAVGDKVTWRSGGKPKPNARSFPIGIANCKVIELGESEGGQPAAMIRLPTPMGSGKVGALIADLYHDE